MDILNLTGISIFDKPYKEIVEPRKQSEPSKHDLTDLEEGRNYAKELEDTHTAHRNRD